MGFRKATKASAWLRFAITGPSGSGKTYTALAVAESLVPRGRIAVLDTEHGSASLYSDRFAFDVMELDDFDPANYTRAIADAVRERYDVLVIDSLSHAWMGVGGILDQLDNAKRNFNKWKDLTPQQNALVDAIIRSDIHIIATMRSKQEYVIEKDSNGKSVPRKLGMASVQRDGMEYEFTAVLDMDMDHVGTTSKTRCPGLDGKAFRKPGADVAKILREWLALDGGKPAANPTQPVETKSSRGSDDGGRGDDPESAPRTTPVSVTAPEESIVDRARKAFASTGDARSLLALASNVLRVEGPDRAGVGAAYRDRWVEMVKAMDTDARKRVLRAIGGMPAEVWELCDWQPFRALLSGDEEASQDTPSAEELGFDGVPGGDY